MADAARGKKTTPSASADAEKPAPESLPAPAQETSHAEQGYPRARRCNQE